MKKLERRPGLQDCTISQVDGHDDTASAEVSNSQAEELIHVLTAAYISSSHHTADYMAKLPEREKDYLVSIHDVFGEGGWQKEWWI